MYGVTGGVTQASHVSVLLSSSLDTGLVDRAADEMFTIFCHLSCDMTMLSTTGGRMAHLRHTPSTMLNTPRHIVTKQRVSGDRRERGYPMVHLYSFLFASLPLTFETNEMTQYNFLSHITEN